MKTILVDALNTLIFKDDSINTPLYKLLEKYPNQKIILTNAKPDEIISKLKGIDYKVFSLNRDPEKIDPKYFEIMLNHFGISSYETIYIEHNVNVVNSAFSQGIKTFHYDYNLHDISSLKKFIDDNLITV